MNPILERRRTWLDANPEIFQSTVNDLEDLGYTPLFRTAQRKAFDIFGIEEDVSPPRHTSYRSRDRRIFDAEAFTWTESKAILLAAIGSLKEKGLFLEIGFAGDKSERTKLEDFQSAITNIIDNTKLDTEWEIIQATSRGFDGLLKDKKKNCMVATEIPEEHFSVSAVLEDKAVRDLATLVKRAGGILAADIKDATEKKQSQEALNSLTSLGLLSQEYVVICRNTSRQTNRVKTKEAIEEMEKLGVLCSCGRPISEERIEKLYAPTNFMSKMLNQSYWMTVRLVHSLMEQGISRDRILLNLHDGPEEIDAFADVDGKLLMFELKDSEFSMGHAYPFGGRIGLYQPYSAIVVSTDGVSPDVKDYFEKVEPDSEIIYIGNLKSLDADIGKTVSEVRAVAIGQMISYFTQTSFQIPPPPLLLAKKLDIDLRNISFRGVRRGWMGFESEWYM
ncbi:MAG: hypothetical protein GF309_13430 [Candidatus Lokiarchaeota archaeon]|nr:hypothetical protein [Candidatus Lokiarchaeota archaeon]